MRAIAAYCRVSSPSQRPDLKNQGKVLADFWEAVMSHTPVKWVPYAPQCVVGARALSSTFLENS